MGMSTHVYAVIEADEEWDKMKKAWREYKSFTWGEEKSAALHILDYIEGLIFKEKSLKEKE